MSERDNSPSDATSGNAREVAELLDRQTGASLDTDLRQRVMAGAERTHRFPELEHQVAALVDLDVASAAELLLAIDRAEAWVEGPSPAVQLLHFDGGPAMQNAITGFVRVQAGGSFPEHTHVGEERVLILQGKLEDSLTGRVYQRGDLVAANASTTHVISAGDDIPLVFLTIVEQGVRIGGVFIGPDDPRG